MEKILKLNGFSLERQNGSHKIWVKGNKTIESNNELLRNQSFVERDPF